MGLDDCEVKRSINLLIIVYGCLTFFSCNLFTTLSCIILTHIFIAYSNRNSKCYAVYTGYLQRLIDSRQTHLSLVFMPKILMKFSLHCRGNLHLKSHFYEGQDNLFLEG